MRGKFIVLESLEAAGKGTATAYMRDYFQQRGDDVLFTREIGGTPYAERIREIMLSTEYPNVPAMSDLLIAYAARIEHTQNVIRPALAAGKHVFSERYYGSTLAYQSQRCPDTFAVHNRLSDYLEVPDLTILLNISPATSLRRMHETRVQRGIALDKFELEGLAYFQGVHKAYHDQVDATWRIVDAERSIDEVKAQLCAIVDQLLGTQQQIPRGTQNGQ